ncbi:MAG: FAD-binding oxidoreductase [Bryobacteraceae bacterium]|nr:FAD-binding oxidoreductase [Bryobacteraceae bacterium]
MVEDASGYQGWADCIVAPQTVEELSELLVRAASLGVAVTPSGAGTGITGGRCPQGGWLISTGRLRRLEVGRGRAAVGAGVLLKDLQAAAARTGQFYAPDPTEWTASLGGTIATNASGSRSFRYGSTRRHLLSVTAVFIDGTVRTFRRDEPLDFPFDPLPQPETTKNTAGYYLPPGATWAGLLCGSEGTLAIVAEAEVSLLPQPEALLTGVVFFRETEAALEAVDAWRGIPQLNMLEFMDEASLEVLRADAAAPVPEAARACLMVEQQTDGVEGDALEQWLDRLERARAMEESWFGTEAADRERFRAFRHALPEAVNARVRSRGFEKISSDFAVPVRRNAEMMAFYRRELERDFAGCYTIYGHIGDAHVHVNILPESAGTAARGRAWMREAAREAVRLGGTVSAEHGLGKRKRELLELMYSEEQIGRMKRVKSRLDPDWRLSPGTLFADPKVTI